MPRLLLFVLFLLPVLLQAQSGTATVFGTVRDDQNRVLPDASINVVGEARGTSANTKGEYELTVPAGIEITVRFGYPGTETQERKLTLAEGEREQVDVRILAITIEGPTIRIDRLKDRGTEPMDPRMTKFQPTLGDVNSLLQGGLGVMTRNELSSGYSVRGGNFDENLVYVNDIEVYRPFLVRAGQQEGLSFPNPDMIDRIQFSAGGFEARYGDKLSSVLDINYKRPREFGVDLTASLLGGSVAVGSPMMNGRLRQITGFRYRTLNAVLKGLDTQGDYRPTYTDLQSYWTYDLSDRVEIGLLALYSRNRYDVKPTDRETEFGNFNQALRYTVYFEGQERTAYETFFGALNVSVKSGRNTLLKFTGSAFRTYETERYDVLGQYRLGELERNLGSEEFGEVVADLGVGSYLDHGRNQLEATVLTFTHKGTHNWGTGNLLRWGADVRTESITDRLSEWYLVDSADFSTPLNTGDDLELMRSVKSKVDLESTRASAYLQNAWEWKAGASATWALITGVRAQHWTYNQQTVVSPRARIVFDPGWKKPVELNGKRDTLDLNYSFWFATGFYYQPPFYRELRDMNGALNPELRAQRSIHFILGGQRQFQIWERPFKFTTEAYYKKLDDLVPYEVDNVRLRYYATNNANGYAYGLDMKLNGEFIKGVESWASLSVMRTAEDLSGDSYYRYFNAAGEPVTGAEVEDRVPADSTLVQAGYIPRPTDQRVSFAMFFQDEMPRAPSFKVHMSLVFGTSLPYGPPNNTRYADTLRTSLYRRVDIGFSKQFIGAEGQARPKSGFASHIKDLYLTLEVFNLINLNNTVDFTWIQDVQGRYYAIPEFLTPRRINVKLIARF
ncbi:MAG TPA: TonB-dependent receptor [Flavobacteriales bacterium]